MFRPISRRTALKGLGTGVALPLLNGMTSLVEASTATSSSSKPIRAAFLYVPNGVHLPDWTPEQSGSTYVLPWILEPLTPFKKDINVLTGLTLDKARPHGDGPGDHARAMAAFLTGRQPRKTNGADIRVGQSADQWIAGKIGEQTRFASLEIGVEPGRPAGNCDSGYSCAYQSNFSWRNESTPNPKEVNPKLVFDRLFGNGPAKEQEAQRANRNELNKSILDFVREDAKALSNQVGANDRRKLDEYLTSIRDIELRIDKANDSKTAKSPPPDIKVPSYTPRDFQEHVRIMADLMILAFQADLTRVVTFPFANDGSNRSYPFLNVHINDKDETIREGHHELSHHGGDKNKHAKIRRINRFHIEQLAYILGKMRSIEEGDKTMLDQVMIVYGSGNADGNRHNHDNLPILLCGSGGGKIKTGLHAKYANETPLMNLLPHDVPSNGLPGEGVRGFDGDADDLEAATPLIGRECESDISGPTRALLSSLTINWCKMDDESLPRDYQNWRTGEFDRAEDAAYMFGYYLMLHCRNEAIATVPEDAAPDVKAAIEKAVDIALHNVCDMLEGFWPLDAGPGKRISLALGIQVRDAKSNVIETVEISPCKLDLPIGYWKWARDREFR